MLQNLFYINHQCPYCLKNISESNFIYCKSCLQNWLRCIKSRNQSPIELPNTVQVYSMSYYTEAMARYIQILKSQPFDFVPGVLKKGVQLLVEHWSEEINHWDFNVLATVPSNFLRAFVETNLTSLFAIELSEKIKKPYLPKLLSSSNCFFPQQKNVSKKDRWQARKKQFVCSNKARGIKNKVLLIDDICTTGSSLFHAAEALKDKGWYCERALVLSSARKLDF